MQSIAYGTGVEDIHCAQTFELSIVQSRFKFELVLS